MKRNESLALTRVAVNYVFVPWWNVEQKLNVFQLTQGAQYMFVWQFDKQEKCIISLTSFRTSCLVDWLLQIEDDGQDFP